jgi:hypothetical protein
MAKAVKQERLTIAISRKLPLKEARQGRTVVAQGASGKILLVA